MSSTKSGNLRQTTVDSTGASLNPATKEGLDAIELNQTDGSQLVGSVDPNDATRKGEFDCKFKVPVMITVEHHEIHEGDSHEIHVDSANAAVASLNVAFKTLAGTKLAHILFGFHMSNEVLHEIIEGATWDTNTGAATTVYNNNRADGGASTVMLEDKTATPTFTATNKVLKNVTNVAGGTVIDAQYTYNAGLGANSGNESREAGHEWVLAPNTTYLVRMTQTGGNCKMSIDLHWYEHTNE